MKVEDVEITGELVDVSPEETLVIDPKVNQPPAKQPAPAQPVTGATSPVPATASSSSVDLRLGLLAILAVLAVLAIALSVRRLRSTPA